MSKKIGEIYDIHVEMNYLEIETYALKAKARLLYRELDERDQEKWDKYAYDIDISTM